MSDKPFEISKWTVWDAWREVKANKGAAGVDGESIEDFERNLKDNLYTLWNRMSSGSYFPSPVKQVLIPKKNGKMRPLGIPTVKDRIAQAVVRAYLEPVCEPRFVKDSYGYRPNKSALDAVGVCRSRCWEYDWVVEFDIVGLFDHIDHGLLFKAVDTVNDLRWVRLYLMRFCTAPIQDEEGVLHERACGVSQGGITSPLLANLFLHYAFDKWMERTHPKCPYERYADDAVIHCRTEREAKRVLEDLKVRMDECKLALHPDKTHIVYCKDRDRRADYPQTTFEFLGYRFGAIFIKDRLGRGNLNFLACASKSSCKSLRQKIKAMHLRSRGQSTLSMIAEDVNPIVRGWLNYFSRYCKSAVKSAMQYVNDRLIAWVKSKYKRFYGRTAEARLWLRAVAAREPNMFVHWQAGFRP